jgi:hypothetical protein
MPHITKAEMSSIDDGRKPMKAGDLTYVLYKECVEYVVRNGRSFSVFCVVMGSLFCAALEIYRLKVSKYEDEKIADNGEALGNLG